MVDRTITAGATLWFDVVVVGAGVAGLVAALDVADADPSLSVAVVDKSAIGRPGSAGSTPLAQGGMAAAVGRGDSPALHASDTARAGDGLCDLHAVAVMTAEGPSRVDDLIARGAVFDREPPGDTGRALALSREGGQTVPRSVKAADATGAEIFRALRTAATGRVTRLQGLACALARPQAGGRVAGVWVLLDDVAASPLGPAQQAGVALVNGRAVLLATGGCGGLFSATTNPDGATADGVAIAYHAGAALSDLEFVQFHPTGLKPSGDGSFQRLLLTEALRGAGAALLDDAGRRFMVDRHPDAELAPRHVVTKGILDQPGGAWLDATHLGRGVVEREFPTVLAGARRAGFDLAAEPVPVEPCEHYMIGGVATDLRGRTNLPGLWAAGEVACTGVHGANRMAGNSLLQSCVFGHRAALDIAREVGSEQGAGREEAEPPRFADAPADLDVGALRAEVRETMTTGAGAIRNAGGLRQAEKTLQGLAASIGLRPSAEWTSVELHHTVAVSRLIVRSGLLREESRGVHWREDFPSHSPAWSGVRMRVQRSGVPGW